MIFHRLLPLALAAALAACGAQQEEPRELTAQPVFNKVGGVEACIGSDGRTYPPRLDQRDPCDPIEDCPDPQRIPGTTEIVCPPPDDCPDGFFDSTGQWICPDPDRNTDDSSDNGGRDPGGNSSTGATAGARG